jgi:predicted permease
MPLRNTLNDLRFGFRQMRRSPGFTLSAVLMLALGIGANIAVFLIFYGVLLRPLPFPDAERLVRIARFYPGGTLAPAYSGTTALFFRRASRAFESVAAYDYVPAKANMLESNDVVPLQVLRVTSDFFRVFGMPPALGRNFNAQDMAPNAPGVVILSGPLWRHQFGADPNIVGKAITLGNRSCTVIGVANSGFHLDAKADLFAPLPIAESPEDHSNEYRLVARLKPGITAAQAESDLERVLRELKDTYPALWDRYESVRVQDLHESLTGDMRPALEMLMGAVALVLLIVAANILSLLMTRSIARRREMSVRVALGASGWAVLRQLLVENTLLCAAGGAGGLLLAGFGAPMLMRFSPLDLPEFVSMQIGTPALLFAITLTLGLALICSLVPAFEARRARLNDSLRMNASQIATGKHFAQKALVVSEVAISLVLLVAADLLLTSFWKLIHTPPGLETANVLTFKNSFSEEQSATSASMGRRLDELTARVEAIPGVEAAGAANTLPTQLTPDLPFDIAGRSPNRADAKGEAKYIPVTAHFFIALRVPVLAGRAFTLSDTSGSAPVLIVNRQFARTYFENENPVGQHVRIGAVMGPGFEDPLREIVGVVGDVKQDGLNSPTPVIAYLPAAQIPDQLTRMDNGLLGTSWVVRTGSAQVDVLPQIRRIFLDNARAPLLAVETMDQIISASVGQQRFSMFLLCGFGLISLGLGAAGLYGVLSYTVARQTKEIGVRMAIGAQRGDIARMVLRSAARLVLIGLAVGIVAALAGVKVLGSLLFGVAPRDPFVLGTASAILLLTGLLAAWWPARRAASIEPMQALRSE